TPLPRSQSSMPTGTSQIDHAGRAGPVAPSTRARETGVTLPDSSTVEHAAVNRGVRGSNPRRGATSLIIRTFALKPLREAHAGELVDGDFHTYPLRALLRGDSTSLSRAGALTGRVEGVNFDFLEQEL